MTPIAEQVCAHLIRQSPEQFEQAYAQLVQLRPEVESMLLTDMLCALARDVHQKQSFRLKSVGQFQGDVESEFGASLSEEVTQNYLHFLSALRRRWSMRFGDQACSFQIGALLVIRLTSVDVLFDRQQRAQKERLHKPQDRLAWINFAGEYGDIILQAFDDIPLDVIRLLSTYPLESYDNWVDVWGLLTTPQANLLAQFSMDLLPSVLESHSAEHEQQYAVDGIASISSRGSIDAIVPSQYAYDDLLFEQRLLSSELFYFMHEKQDVVDKKADWIVIDGSAVMRGFKNICARGLGIALATHRLRQNRVVDLSFFDSNLRPGKVLSLEQMHLSYVLGAHFEFGQNYGGVFEQIYRRAKRQRKQEDVEITVTLISEEGFNLSQEVAQQCAEEVRLRAILLTDNQVAGNQAWRQYFDEVTDLPVSKLIRRSERAEAASQAWL